MKITDFEYAGIKLSAKNCMICNFDSVGLDTVSIGANLSYTTVRDNNSYEQRKVSASYDDPEDITLQFCKNNCNDVNDRTFSEEEIRDIAKWLNRESPEVFKPIYDKIYSGTYFKGFFNISKKILGKDVIGFEVTFSPNAPYGFCDYKKSADLSASGTISINTDSDKIGYIYPNISITCKQAGDLTLTNTTTGEKTIIKNCSQNEIITISETKVITSSMAHSTLSMDFNYVHPRLKTSYSSDLNIFSTSLPCTITFSYKSIRKVGVL